MSGPAEPDASTRSDAEDTNAEPIKPRALKFQNSRANLQFSSPHHQVNIAAQTHLHTSSPAFPSFDSRPAASSTPGQLSPNTKMSSDQVAAFQTASPQTGEKRHQSSTSPHPSIQSFATTPPSSPDSPSQQPNAQALPLLSTSTQALPPPRASESSRLPKRSSAEKMPSQESDQSDDEFLGLTGPQCVFCDMCLDTEPPCCCPSCELPNYGACLEVSILAPVVSRRWHAETA